MTNSIYTHLNLRIFSILIIIILLSGCRKEKNEIILKTPGVVTGTIWPASAVLSVSIESKNGGHVYNTLPDSNGIYIFTDIPQGVYTLKAEVSSIYNNLGEISFMAPETGTTTLDAIFLKYNPSAQTGVITFTLDSVNYTISSDSIRFTQSNSFLELKGNTIFSPDYFRFEMGFNYLADPGSYSYNNSYFRFELFYYEEAGSMLKEYWRIVGKGPSHRITITSNDKIKRSVSGTFDVLLSSFYTVNAKRLTGTFTDLRY